MTHAVFFPQLLKICTINELNDSGMTKFAAAGAADGARTSHARDALTMFTLE
jgi:hypothetical protein